MNSQQEDFLMTTGFAAHDWQGKVFLVLTYGFAAIWAMGTLAMLASPSEGVPLGMAEGIILLGLVGVHVAIARGVAGFTNWGWWAGMIIGVLTIPLGILFLYYFWTRRYRFGSHDDVGYVQDLHAPH